MRKLLSTIRIAGTLAMARTFGRYEHSGWNGEFSYARYRFAGRSWVIPTGPADEPHGDVPALPETFFTERSDM